MKRLGLAETKSAMKCRRDEGLELFDCSPPVSATAPSAGGHGRAVKPDALQRTASGAKLLILQHPRPLNAPALVAASLSRAPSLQRRSISPKISVRNLSQDARGNTARWPRSDLVSGLSFLFFPVCQFFFTDFATGTAIEAVDDLLHRLQAPRIGPLPLPPTLDPTSNSPRRRLPATSTP